MVVLICRSRNAMDNASKNASDMIGKLQMQYNRGRQASITNELVDIITGACLPISVQRRLLNAVLPLQVQVHSERSRWSCACDIIVEICVHVLYLPAAYGPFRLTAPNHDHEPSGQATRELPTYRGALSELRCTLQTCMADGMRWGRGSD